MDTATGEAIELANETKQETAEETEGDKENEPEDEDDKEYGQVKIWSDKHGPHQVYYNVDVKLLSNVSNIDQSFDVSFDVTFEWMASKEEKTEYEQSKVPKTRWKPPRMTFPTLMEHTKDPSSTIEVVMTGAMFCFRETRSFKSKLAEKMELKSFPFDVQDFTIPLIFPVSHEEAQFFPSLTIKKGEFIRVQPQYNLPEWKMHPPMFEQQVLSKQIINSSFHEQQMNHTKIVIALKCERVWISFFWRIFVLSTLISFTLLAIFVIEYESVADRLAHGVTILLTMVAFQFVVQSYLPNLGYLTILDWYLLFMDAYVVAVIVLASIPQLFEKWNIMDDADILDTLFFAFSAVSLLIINIWVFIKIKYYIIPVELAKLKATQGQLAEINDDTEELKEFSVINKFTSVQNGNMIYYGDIHTQTEDNVNLSCLEWSGIYQSTYSVHDVEYQYVFTQKDDDGNMKLVARKITGDPNVPAGKITWILNEIPVFKTKPNESDTKIKGNIHLRSDIHDPNGFYWGDITLQSASENQIKFIWHCEWNGDIYPEECVYDRYRKVVTK